MRTPSLVPGSAAVALGLTLAGSVHGALNTLRAWGNAAGTNPAPSFTSNGGTITIRAGGADFWGTSDAGAFLFDNTGAHTTTGDFTATVRHVSTTNPAPEWGRDGIVVRATQTPGTPAANDAHWLAHRKSNGQYITGRRPTAGANTYRATDIGNAGVNYSSDTNDQAFATGDVRATPYFISAGREGDRMHSGYALDLGGVPGRWIEHWSTDVPDAISGLQGGAEVIVGLAHQSHPQTISPDSNDINTATFDNWSYSGTYSPEKFGGLSSPTTWQVGGSLAVSPAGAVTGSAYVQEGGTATGENVKWTVRVSKLSTFFATFDTAGSRKDPMTMEVEDLVPPANFRQGGDGSPAGLLADIYLSGNAGNSIANLGFIASNPPNGTAIVPNIHWSNPDGPGYPDNGAGGNVFEDAVPGSFGPGANQENFGVDHHGQIFIPPDAARTSLGLPNEVLIFKDGVDDFCYLEIDGHVLINDNDWTGNFSFENGGGNLAVMDVSAPKFNDGEWVPFRMVTWEGGGGDTASLYWNAFDTNGTFVIDQVPGTAGNYTPTLALPGSTKDPTAMEPADLVPSANFRMSDGVTPALKADIYLHGNDGNFTALNNYINANPPNGTVTLPRIHWSHPDAGVGYPPNGAGGDLFSDAIPAWQTTGDGQEDYGVNLTGQILIPGDAARTTLNAPGGNNLIAFEDGVDDFCYLAIDGTVLINDNNWTGNSSVDNGGGNISLFDASAAKFDDGEWVSFRMITWEGGGGDTASLYWSALDTNSSFQRAQLPGPRPPDHTYTGSNQVGSESTTGVFVPQLPPGDWFVQLTVENTRTSLTRVAVASVATPPQITAFTYDPAITTLNLTFSSQAGSNYALEYTTGFQPAGAPPAASKWNTVPSHASIPGVAGTTAIAPLNTSTLVTPGGQLPNNSQVYVRVRKL